MSLRPSTLFLTLQWVSPSFDTSILISMDVAIKCNFFLLEYTIILSLPSEKVYGMETFMSTNSSAVILNTLFVNNGEIHFPICN